MQVIVYRVRCLARSQRRAAAALAVVVAVTGALVLTLVAGARRTLSAPARYTTSYTTDADVGIEQQSGPPRREEIAGLPSVESVAMTTFVFGALSPAGEVPDEIAVDSLVFAGELAGFALRLEEGREPDPGRADEFAVSSSFLEANGARLGDRFTLRTISPETSDARGFDVDVPDGPTIEASVVGVFSGPNDLEEGYAIALFSAQLLKNGDVGVSASHSAVSLREGATVDDLRRDLDTLPDAALFAIDQSDDLVPESVRDAVRIQGQGLAVLAGIAALATAVVLGQLFVRRTRLSGPQAGALRALGFTPAQLVADPVGRAAPAVIVGSVAAGVVAFVVSDRFPSGFARRVEPAPGPRFDVVAHVIGPVAITITLLTVIALAAARPAGARPDLRPPRLVSSIIPYVAWPSAATGLRFAFTRRGGSQRTSLVGLLLVAGGLIGALTFGASIGRLVDDPARFGSPPLTAGAGGQAVPAEARAVFEADEDIEALAFGATVSAAAGDGSIDVSAIEPVRGDLMPDILVGRLPVGDDEIVLGRVEARKLGLEIGDEIELRGVEEGGYRVTGFAILPGIFGADGVGNGGLVTMDGLLRLDPDATVAEALIRLRPGAPSDTTARLSEAAGVGVGRPDPPAAMVNLARVRNIPYVVAAVLAFLAALSLAHLSLVTVQARRRDLAVLRALGADARWITSVVHSQATALATVIGVVALPIGVAAGGLLYRIYADRLGTRPGPALPALAIAVEVVAALVIANLIAAVPARRARRLRTGRLLGEE